MKTDIEQLKELVEAGKRATDGDWNHDGNIIFACDYDRTWEKDILEFWTETTYEADCTYIIQSANTRPALERVIKRYEEMERALKIISTECIVDKKGKTLPYDTIIDNRKVARKALELSDEERGESDVESNNNN